MRCHSDPKLHVCPRCNKAFRWKSMLKQHVNIHTQETTFICPYCGNSFLSAANFKRHLLTHSYTCHRCGESFSRHDQLMKHIYFHTVGWCHTCRICGKGFKRLDSMKTHVLVHTKGNPQVFCQYTQNQSAVINAVLRNDTGDKPDSRGSHRHPETDQSWSLYLDCEICVHGFNSQQDLEFHIKAPKY